MTEMRNKALFNNTTPTSKGNVANDAEKLQRTSNTCKSQSFTDSGMQSEPTYEVPDTLETIFDAKWKTFKKIEKPENTERRPSIPRIDKEKHLK